MDLCAIVCCDEWTFSLLVKCFYNLAWPLWKFGVGVTKQDKDQSGIIFPSCKVFLQSSLAIMKLFGVGVTKQDKDQSGIKSDGFIQCWFYHDSMLYSPWEGYHM